MCGGMLPAGVWVCARTCDGEQPRPQLLLVLEDLQNRGRGESAQGACKRGQDQAQVLVSHEPPSCSSAGPCRTSGGSTARPTCLGVASDDRLMLILTAAILSSSIRHIVVFPRPLCAAPLSPSTGGSAVHGVHRDLWHWCVSPVFYVLGSWRVKTSVPRHNGVCVSACAHCMCVQRRRQLRSTITRVAEHRDSTEHADRVCFPVLCQRHRFNRVPGAHLGIPRVCPPP